MFPPMGILSLSGARRTSASQQTMLGLLETSRKTYVGRDAIGSRHPENKETAVRRLERHGAEVVTTEMVIFEWLKTAEHPRFRQAIALIN
jgi:hypothetical protein